jgi:hypothetical protein
MGLENKTCQGCNKKFEDGEILNEHKKKYYHYDLENSKHPLAMSCSIQIPKNKIGVFYKNNFYNLDNRLKEIISKRCKIEYISDEKRILIGQKVSGDLSFLDNLESD